MRSDGFGRVCERKIWANLAHSVISTSHFSANEFSKTTSNFQKRFGYRVKMVMNVAAWLSGIIFWRAWVDSRNFVLGSAANQRVSCHTFPQGKSRRWARILKNALSMVSGCMWTLPPDFLKPKYQLSDAISRNLAFEFPGISFIVTLYEKDGPTTRSDILWLFGTGQRLDIAHLSIK